MTDHTRHDTDLTVTPERRRRLAAQFGETTVRHSERFRLVSTRYPHMVALAYDRDLAAAMADSDEQVTAKVAAWEIAHGFEPRDWWAIGRAEGRDDQG